MSVLSEVEGNNTDLPAGRQERRKVRLGGPKTYIFLTIRLIRLLRSFAEVQNFRRKFCTLKSEENEKLALSIRQTMDALEALAEEGRGMAAILVG